MSLGPAAVAASVLGVSLLTALAGAPFLRTATGRRAFGTLAALPAGRAAATAPVSRRRVVATYGATVVGYGLALSAVGLAGPQSVGAGASAGDVAVVLLPYGVVVAAVGSLLPLYGVEWRRGLDRTRATLVWAGFLAAVTGCVLVGRPAVLALVAAGVGGW